MYYVLPLLLSTFTVDDSITQPIYCYTNMQVTPKKTNTIHYLPQEIKRNQTHRSHIFNLLTREMLEQLFSNSAKKDKHKLVKKRRR